MTGFVSTDDQVNKVSALGQRWEATWSKQMNPTAAAVANEHHTLFRGGGMPQADAIFDVGTNLQMQTVHDVTTNAGCIQHGGNVGANGDDFKQLLGAVANTAAATVAPCVLYLIDVLAFFRVTTVTTTTAQNTICANTFTASSSGGLLLTFTNDWGQYPKVRFTTTGALPTGLALNTDYWLVRVSATTANVATTFANALAGTVIAFTDAGSGTHTVTVRLPRYSDGAGVQGLIFNPSATPLGAGTPQLTLGYTNSAGVAGRATPTLPSPPIGKTAASNSHVLYSGATGAGKFGPQMPLQGADAGIRSVETIRNSTSYVSGSYTLALYQQIGRIPITALGQDTWMDLTTVFPSYPRVYDGAALYWILKSGLATPANSLFDGTLLFGWGN